MLPAPEPFTAEMWHGTASPRGLLTAPVRCGGHWADDEPRLGLYLTGSREETFNYGHTPVAVAVRFRRALRLTLPAPEEARDPTDQVLAAVGLSADGGEMPPGAAVAELGYDGVVIDFSDGARWAVPLTPAAVTVTGADTRLQDAEETLAPLWSAQSPDALRAALRARQALAEDPAFAPADGWDAWAARWRADEY